MNIDRLSKSIMILCWITSAAIFSFSGKINIDTLFIGVTLLCSAYLIRKDEDNNQ